MTVSMDQFFCRPFFVILASRIAQMKSDAWTVVMVERLCVPTWTSGPVSARSGSSLGQLVSISPSGDLGKHG